jgi:hypothetical protein
VGDEDTRGLISQMGIKMVDVKGLEGIDEKTGDSITSIAKELRLI